MLRFCLIYVAFFYLFVIYFETMNARSYVAVLIVAGCLLYFLLDVNHNLESDIIQSEQQLRFYLADSYRVEES